MLEEIRCRARPLSRQNEERDSSSTVTGGKEVHYMWYPCRSLGGMVEKNEVVAF